MSIPIISNLIEYRKQYRLRRIKRGYHFLRDSNSLDKILSIKQIFTNSKLNIRKNHYSKYIFNHQNHNAEIIIRQYLLLKAAGLNFNKAILYAIGKQGSSAVLYIPPEWRNIIQEQGVQVASIRTALLWNAYVIIMLGYGFFKILKIIFNGIKSVWSKSTQQLGRYVFFSDLSPGNLPKPGFDGCSYDIISWYRQWPGWVKDIDTLCHGIITAEKREVNGISVIPIQTPVPPLSDYKSLSRFIMWGFMACLIATWDFLRGRWWHALLLNQAALATQVRINAEQLAKEYLFHNSGWFYRPLWTYEAERLGAQITFYFYSTNCELFKRPLGYPPLNYGWQIMNWPRYLVWNEYQADFVRRSVGESVNISIVGPIWFHSDSGDIPTLPPRSVAVFDVQPMCEENYITLGIDFEYYTHITANQFLYDIHIAMKNFDGVMCLKRKREIGSLAHPDYRQFVEKLSNLDNFISINPNISALRLIEGCAAVVSLPFTSTALIGRELGKPSCYYDPTGLVQKDDRAAHGIEIIIGPDELKRWLMGIEMK